jgi:hypothetical protein
MNKLFTALGVAAICGLAAGGAFAQTTTQQSVLGVSGNPDYPVQVFGQNGVAYNCEEEIVQLATGQPARTCIRATDAGGSVFDNATALNSAGPAIGLIVVGAALAGSSDGTTSTTTTN